MKKYRQPLEPMVICIPTPILKLPTSWPGCFSIRLPPRALQTIPATSTPQLTTRKWNKKCNRNAIKSEKKPQILDFTGSAAHLRLFERGVFLVVLNCICLSFVQIHALFTSITSFILTYWFSVAKMLPSFQYNIVGFTLNKQHHFLIEDTHNTDSYWYLLFWNALPIGDVSCEVISI